MYETHKSWYSWLLGSLVGAVYARAGSSSCAPRWVRGWWVRGKGLSVRLMQ